MNDIQASRQPAPVAGRGLFVAFFSRGLGFRSTLPRGAPVPAGSIAVQVAVTVVPRLVSPFVTLGYLLVELSGPLTGFRALAR